MSVIFINSYWFAGSPIAPPDPNFNLVSLLLHGDGTNGAQNNTFLDGSTNNFTITRVGNTTQGTFSPFSPTGWSGYFKDSVADYLTTPSSAQFNMGTGDWTVEGWFYGNKALNQFNVAWHVGTINATDGMAGSVASNSVGFRSNGTTDISASISIANQWAHIAWVKVASSNTVTIYVNGASVASGTYSNSIATGTFTCGFNNTSFRYGGYMSNLRVLKGTAQYTSNFTPPTTPLTAIANTSLLTLQDNRFKDNSTNNFTITRFGDTKIQAFSPFNPTAAYSASTHGGSGYFDGTGDYLTTAASNENNFGTSDFTIEFWINSTKTTRSDPFGWNYSFSNAGWAGFIFNLSSSGDMAWYENTNSRISASATGWNNGAWNHVALTRSGNSVRMFLNGTQVGSTYTTSFSYGANSSGFIVGDIAGGGGPVNGYISGLRVLKGTAQYTSNFTPPTAPLTAITNTSLLLNFTNAGIIDNASKNVLETVGNAQISTSVKKFGTGSLAFDGTGDRLTGPFNQWLALGTSDFTIETWIRFNSVSSSVVIGNINGSGNGDWALIYNSSVSQIRLLLNSVAVVLSSSSWTPSAGSWYHIAITRASGTYRFFVGGTLTGSGSDSTNITWSSANRFLIGSANDGSLTLNGYIDDLRITKGVARYTANFTPPTQAFPDL